MKHYLYEVSTSELVDELCNRVEVGAVLISVPNEGNTYKKYRVAYGTVEQLRIVRDVMIKMVDEVHDAEAGKRDFEIM